MYLPLKAEDAGWSGKCPIRAADSVAGFLYRPMMAFEQRGWPDLAACAGEHRGAAEGPSLVIPWDGILQPWVLHVLCYS